jgi:gliding motility-associated-like protein
LNNTATVTVEYKEQPPVAENDNNSGNKPGENATINILNNDKISDLSKATLLNTTVELIDPKTELPATNPNQVEVENEGIWTYNPDSGQLTFNPMNGFTTDPSPIVYLLTEKLTGLKDEANVVTDYVGANPVATNDFSSGHLPGSNATLNVLTNDELSDGSHATSGNSTIVLIDPSTGNPTTTPNELLIENQGLWTYDPIKGLITFDPKLGFTIDPTPIKYVLMENSTGLTDDATVSFDYEITNPIASNDSITGITPGNNAKINILLNDFLSDGSAATTTNTTVHLIDPITGELSATPNEVKVTGIGVWTYNQSTGEISFDPVEGFTSSPIPISYNLGENGSGLNDVAIIFIAYGVVAPSAVNDSSNNNSPGEEVSVSILANDNLSDGSPALTKNTEVALIDPTTSVPSTQPNIVIVEKQGTWLYNTSSGLLTFTPEKGFTSDPDPITYRLTEILTGLSDNAEVSIYYNKKQPFAENDSSLDNPMGSMVTIGILNNDSISDGSPALVSNSKIELLDNSTGNPGNDPYKLVVPGEGIWEYNPTNGILAFSQESNVELNPTPIQYKLTEVLTGLSDNAVVSVTFQKIIITDPPVANDDNFIAGDCKPIVLDVLQNDYIPEDGTTSLKIVSNVNHGTLVLNIDNSFTYTPERGFEGTTNFEYQLCKDSDSALCSDASVEINVYSDTDCDEITDIDDIDDDNDGIVDFDEGNGTIDTDDDKIPDSFDIDSDNDGISDNVEWQSETKYIEPSGKDLNRNGLDDAYEAESSDVVFVIIDTDSDKIPDYIDPDSDNDNIPDSNEGHDANFDAIADLIPTGFDSDNDGLDDIYDIIDGWNNPENSVGSNAYLQDYDNDGIRDWRDTDDDNDGNPTTGPENKFSATSENVFVPNVFSPNGDGIQDYFRIQNIEKYPEAKIEIYNRWGKLVYELENYGNTDIWGETDAWWNGYSNNNLQFGTEILPSATYFYILYLNNGSDPQNGFVYLSN